MCMLGDVGMRSFYLTVPERSTFQLTLNTYVRGRTYVNESMHYAYSLTSNPFTRVQRVLDKR